MKKQIVILSGSVREGRKSHYVAELITEKLKNSTNHDIILLDLKEYPLPLMETRLDNKNQYPETLKKLSSALINADGIIIVSPEYKNGIPGALKNALDYLKPQIFRHKPIGNITVSSGGFGGINCLSQLRLVSLAMGGLPIPEKLCVSNINEFFNNSGAILNTSINEKTTQFLDAFLWYVKRMSVQNQTTSQNVINI